MRVYKADVIGISGNTKTEKNVLDTVKGCPGARQNGGKGCYGACYAIKMAAMTKIDFGVPVKQVLNEDRLRRQLGKLDMDWVRCGVMGDPCMAWDTTCRVAELCAEAGKELVIITKAWEQPSELQLKRLAEAGAQLQVSLSALDTVQQVHSRTQLLFDYADMGGKAVGRVITVALKGDHSQDWIIGMLQSEGIPVLETPLRFFRTTPCFENVDKEMMKKHSSYKTGKEDNQFHCGQMYGVAGCVTSCGDCEHQCMTVDSIGMGKKNQERMK